MNTRTSSLTLAIALGLGMATLVVGCNRAETAATTTATAAPVTVGTALDDTVATTRVKSALLSDQEVKGFDIKVETRKGTVLLSGFVDTALQMDRAIATAKTIEGVQAVDNGITLRTGSETAGNKLDDVVLTTKVKSALVADAAIKSAQIGVVVRKGDVQLSGFVDTQSQIDQAIAVAKSVDGVSGVVNEMSVKK